MRMSTWQSAIGSRLLITPAVAFHARNVQQQVAWPIGRGSSGGGGDL